MKTANLNTIAWLTGASRTLIAFLLPILADSTARLLTALLPIALDVVSSLADSARTGAEKRERAADQIKAACVAAGIQATSQTVNLSIELALAKLQEGSAAR